MTSGVATAGAGDAGVPAASADAVDAGVAAAGEVASSGVAVRMARVVGAAIGFGPLPPPARVPMSTPRVRLDSRAAPIRIRRVRSTPLFIWLPCR